MSVYKKLIEVQSKLKAPKNQRNNFGNYNYRSCEDILEALKPILSEVGATIIVSDEMISVNERYYVKATVRFIDTESGEMVEASANAREDDNKKGMDSSQLTGSTSSYARKYALNGMFAIDDTKDSDFINTHEKEEKKASTNELSEAQIKRLFAIAKNNNLSNEDVIKGIMKYYNKTDAKKLTKAEYDELIAKIDKKG